jgi:MerR family transcriptional regulator, light-induced transcriptional regulator
METHTGGRVHPIGVVADRTGLSPEVLRVWERRYAVVTPTRDASGRRLYSDEDVERLRLLARASAAGRGIGQLAGLSTAELVELVRGDEAARHEGHPAAPSDGADVVEEALVQARALDAPGLDRVLRSAATRRGLPAFVGGVAAPLFRRIGEEWHAGRLTSAQEHLASAVMRSVIGSQLAALSVQDAGAVLVSTPAGERHEIGALLAAGLAAAEGWKVTYLGPDLPAAELAAAATAIDARAVLLSIVFPADRDAALAELHELRERLPQRVAVIVGGGAIAGADGELREAGIAAATDLEHLRRMLRDLESGLPPR